MIKIKVKYYITYIQFAVFLNRCRTILFLPLIIIIISVYRT